MSMCECSIDYDGPDFLREKHVKARKPHQCSDCRGAIQPGEVYLHTTGMWDGDISTFKTCKGCQGLRRLFRCAPYGAGELKRAVWDELDEVGDIPLGNIGVAGAAKLEAFIESWEELALGSVK